MTTSRQSAAEIARDARQVAMQSRLEADPRYASIVASGGEAPQLITYSNRRLGQKRRASNTQYRYDLDSATDDNREKQLKVNQREQLASQKQELAQLKLQRRKRSTGRQSLLKSLPKSSALGPPGTLA